MSGNSGSDNGSEDDDDSMEATVAKYADFSPSFNYMTSGNDSGVIVTQLSDKKKCIFKFEDEKPTVCKFSYKDEYIAVGFTSGLVRVSCTEYRFVIERIRMFIDTICLLFRRRFTIQRPKK